MLQFDIQRYPTGFADLLGMRTTGETPHILGQEVRTVIDATDFYLYDRVIVQVGQSPVAIGAVGWLAQTTGATTIPQGECWVLYDVSLRVPAIAAATALNTVAAIQRTGPATCWIPITEPVKLAAGEGALAARNFDQPMLLRPGDIFGTYTSNLTGVPGSQVFMTVVYAVLKV